MQQGERGERAEETTGWAGRGTREGNERVSKKSAYSHRTGKGGAVTENELSAVDPVPARAQAAGERTSTSVAIHETVLDRTWSCRYQRSRSHRPSSSSPSPADARPRPQRYVRSSPCNIRIRSARLAISCPAPRGRIVRPRSPSYRRARRILHACPALRSYRPCRTLPLALFACDLSDSEPRSSSSCFLRLFLACSLTVFLSLYLSARCSLVCVICLFRSSALSASFARSCSPPA